WSEADTANFTKNFLRPAVDNFLNQNGWFMNQNGYPCAAAMSGDIFANDRKNYEKRVEWFSVNKTAPNPGWSSSIKHLARLVETNAVTGEKVAQPQVQLMEMGRDQAHAGDDMEIFNNTARQMNAQGTKVDPVAGTISTAANAVGPYEFLDDRILAAADYFSRFMLGYDTPWIPAAYDIKPNGQVRGIYPRLADSYRGRIRQNDYWDAFYYYTYKKGVDMAKKAPYYHEAFTKRIISSSIEWIFIPKEAVGEAAKVAPSVQEPDVIQVVQRSTSLTTNSFVVSDGNEAFLRMIPTDAGTSVALLSSDTASKTIGLRIRTTGVAILEMSGFAKPWLLPNTQGEWRYVTYNMAKLEHWGDIVFVRVKGSSGITVDISQLLRKPEAQLIAPAFSAGNEALRNVTYVGAPVVFDFSAKGRAASGNLVYESLDKPEGSVLDTKTGAFSWKPVATGEFSFFVTAASGKTIAPKKVTVVVAPDRSAVVKMATAGFDPTTAYVSASLARDQAACTTVAAAIKTASDAEFYRQLVQLQQAVNALEPLTPLLADGSMDFPKVVASSNIGEAIALLVDGNDDTFPVYSLAKNLNYEFDFGPDYMFSATAFAMEGRLNFEDRMANTKFFGSNDGKNWTELTPQATKSATELTRVEVTAGFRKTKFRYLRIQKQGAGLFESAELRIYGQRYEAGREDR
ncbi:MAG: hypothetical protein RLY20_155, partial [Verrucomicrobiota bacterium]